MQSLREKFPQYPDLSDQQLTDAVHKKFYADLPSHEFYNKVGLTADIDTGELHFVHNSPKKQDNSTFLGRAGEAFSEGVGDRLGLDNENYWAVKKHAGFLTPLVDGVAAAGDVAAGAFKAGMGGVADTAHALGMGDNRDKMRRDFTEFGEIASLPLAGMSASTTGAGQAARRQTTNMAQRPANIARASVQKVKSAKPFQAPEKLADKRFAQALQDDMLDSVKLKERLDGWQGVDAPTPLDLVGESGLARARDTASNIGPARQVLDDYSQAVLADQGSRARKVFTSNLSDKTDFLKEMDELAATRQKAAKPLYDAARQQAVAPTPNMRMHLGTDGGQKAIKNALRIANEGNAKLTGIVKANKRYTLADNVPVDTLDTIKRGFDDVVEKYRDKTTGKLVLDQLGEAKNRTLRSFINEVDQLSPEYRQARDAWAGPSQAMDAMQRGQKYMQPNKSPADIKKILSDPSITASEKEFFRAGAVQSLMRQMQKRADGANQFKAVARSSDQRAKLAELFGGDTSRADVFFKQLKAESERAERANFISPKTGSATNPRAKAGEQLSAMDLLDVNSPSFMARMGGKAINAVRSKASIKKQQEIDEAFARLITQPINSIDDLPGLLDLKK